MLLRSAVAVEGGIRRSHSHEQLTSLANHGAISTEPPMARSHSHEQLSGLSGVVAKGISCVFDPLSIASTPFGTPRSSSGNSAARRTVFQTIKGGTCWSSNKQSALDTCPTANEENDAHARLRGNRQSDMGDLAFDPLVGLHRRRFKGQAEDSHMGLQILGKKGTGGLISRKDRPSTKTVPLIGEMHGTSHPLQDRAPKISSSTAKEALPCDVLEGQAPSASPDSSEKDDEAASEPQTRCLKRRKSASLALLNVLAAMHGTNSVANKLTEQVNPAAPASLTSAVRGLSAAIVFAPALKNAIARKDAGLLWAGMELGAWLFLGGLMQSLGKGNSVDSSAPLLFTFSLVFVPVMEFCAGKSVSKLTWLATIAALSGMGLLEEQGIGWDGIMLPKVKDLWTLASSVISAVHIFRSEALASKFDSLELNAVQMASLAALGIGWELFDFFTAGHGDMQQLVHQLEALPWAPLLYSGLVCSGFANWLELKGLKNVHASTATLIYTTIPVWGGFFSLVRFGEVPGTSATVGAAIVLAASVFAQVTKPLAEQDASVPVAAAPVPTGQEAALKNNGKLEPLLVPEGVAAEGYEAESPGGVKAAPVDLLPGALLSSQLKFPYYAAQVQQMLGKAKIKVTAVKAAAAGGHVHTLAAAAGGHVANAVGTGGVAGGGVPDISTISTVVGAGITNVAESTAAAVGATMQAAGLVQQTVAVTAEALVGTVEAVVAPTIEAAGVLAETTESVIMAQIAGESAVPANGLNMAEACAKVADVQAAAADTFLHLMQPAAKVFPPLGELAHASANIDVAQFVHDLASTLIHIQL